MAAHTNRFREARGRRLAAKVHELSFSLARPIRVLDLGGRTDYWRDIDVDPVEEIVFLNTEQGEIGTAEPDRFSSAHLVGSACDLSRFDDASFDLVHANSVIEHVGGWDDMGRMASEMIRVGRSGWCQTPAWGFPIEPHFRLPFVHWLPAPAGAAFLRLSPLYGSQSRARRRWHIERINLVSLVEMRLLFPGTAIEFERLGFVKSYIASW